MSWLHDDKSREHWIRFVQSLGPEIDSMAVSIIDELRFVSRAIYHVGEHSLDDAGLSFAQYKVLMHLFFTEHVNERGDMNPSQISDRQGVSRNTMSSLIRNLENDGLVERRLDVDDRRRFNRGAGYPSPLAAQSRHTREVSTPTMFKQLLNDDSTYMKVETRDEANAVLISTVVKSGIGETSICSE